MGLAYELALIPSKIIEHAKAGERDPERLCEAVLEQWRGATLPPPIAPSDQI